MPHDGTADHVAWRKISKLMQITHDRLAFAIHQFRSLAAHSFADQVSRCASNIQRGGMELHEFQVSQVGARAPRHRYAITRGNFWIAGFAENLSATTTGQHRGLSPNNLQAMLGMPCQHTRRAAYTLALIHQNVNCETAVKHAHASLQTNFLHKTSRQFHPGGVAIAMDNSVAMVSAF